MRTAARLGWFRPGAALGGVVLAAAASLAGPAVWASPALAADPELRDSAPAVIWHGPRTDRVVALTFDDGWSPATLRRIYAILVRERVPATFFVTGIYVRRAPALWRQIAEAGFPLANHSYLHRDTRNLPARAVMKDLTLTRRVVERATGRPMLPYFRPPYGSRNQATDRLAAAAGFPYIVMWDTTAADTARLPTVASVVRSATAGRPGSIVLLHAGPDVTPRALPAIIAAYRARGFRFVTVPELLGGARSGPRPDLGLAPSSGGEANPADAPDGRPRSVDRPRDLPERFGGRLAVAAAGGRVAQPGADRDAPPPAHPVPTSSPAPPARDAAWARRDGAPTTVALFTVAVLVILVVGAAAAGRRRREDPSA